jgi:hypothetical protein
MGNSSGKCARADCLNLKDHLSPDDFTKLISETYTVLRSNGEEESGHYISSYEHKCKMRDFYPAAHATRMTTGDMLKIFLTLDTSCPETCHRDHDHEGHVCGWRTCSPGKRGFWPTRLHGEEREAWYLWLDKAMSELNFPTRSQALAENEICEAARAARDNAILQRVVAQQDAIEAIEAKKVTWRMAQESCTSTTAERPTCDITAMQAQAEAEAEARRNAPVLSTLEDLERIHRWNREQFQSSSQMEKAPAHTIN